MANTDQKLIFFSEADSVAAVNARIDRSVSGERLAQVAESLTRHLHAFIKDIEPSHEEWLEGIKFLTDTGHFCSEWRQEFILLSDILGASMLVDTINSRRPTGATENTILGPFYVADRPMRDKGASICRDGKGEPCLVTGIVRSIQGEPIAGAIVDVWQTNDDGFYDVQQKELQPENNMRGAFETDSCGRYTFRTVKPRYYPIPNDGPVGKLLERLGRHPNRAAHIHAIVTAKGYDTVITHIFEPECAYLHEDAVFGVKESLVGDFVKNFDKAAAAEAGFPECEFFWEVHVDFTLSGATGRTAMIHQV